MSKGFYQILAGTEVLAVSNDFGIANSLYHDYKYEKKFRYPELLRLVFIENGHELDVTNFNGMTKKQYQDYKWFAKVYGWRFQYEIIVSIEVL